MRLIDDDHYARLCLQVDDWCRVRELLIMAGCRFRFLNRGTADDTAAVNQWLEGVAAMRSFTADGTHGILVEDVLRQVEEASKKGDSSLLECAGIVIRRLMEKAQPDAGPLISPPLTEAQKAERIVGFQKTTAESLVEIWDRENHVYGIGVKATLASEADAPNTVGGANPLPESPVE